jgi:hypothetical protein
MLKKLGWERSRARASAGLKIDQWGKRGAFEAEAEHQISNPTVRRRVRFER